MVNTISFEALPGAGKSFLHFPWRAYVKPLVRLGQEANRSQ